LKSDFEQVIREWPESQLAKEAEEWRIKKCGKKDYKSLFDHFHSEQEKKRLNLWNSKDTMKLQENL
jgi:hypothetical protein